MPASAQSTEVIRQPARNAAGALIMPFSLAALAALLLDASMEPNV
jgi:hypothetical protein